MYSCLNRSKGGYSMKVFPRNITLQKLWGDKCKRLISWTPKSNSFLRELSCSYLY